MSDLPSGGSNRRFTGAQKVVERQMQRLEDAGWKGILADYKAAQEVIEKELLELYRRHAVNGKLTLAEMTRYNRLSKMNKQIEEDLAPFVKSGNKKTVTLIESEWHESFFRHGYTIHDGLKIDVAYHEIPHGAVANIVNSDATMGSLRDLNQTTLSKLRREIRQGIILGEDYPTITKRVEDTMGTSVSGHERIVRTEGQRAYVTGKQDSYDYASEVGLIFIENWIATHDADTRPSHGQMDGQEAKEIAAGDQPSQVGVDGKATPVTHGYYHPEVGHWFRGPLQSGVASFDINCRCTTVTGFEGLEPTEGTRGPKGVTKDLTYDQWRRKYKIRDTSKLIIPGGL